MDTATQNKDHGETSGDLDERNGSASLEVPDGVDIDRANSVDAFDRPENLPIDRGWAWVVLVASFFEMAIIIGYFKCFGIFFVQFQRHFRSTSAATSVIFSLHNVFSSISAMLVTNLGDAVPSRFFVVLGAVMLSACYFVTGFVEDIRVVYVIGGALTGISFSFVQPHALSMLNTYFEKYRSLANSIAQSGVSIGGLGLAPFYVMAFENFGFTSTFMIQAGLALQVVVVGMLLRPMDYFRNQNRQKLSKMSTKVDDDNDELTSLKSAVTYSTEAGIKRDIGNSESLLKQNQNEVKSVKESVGILNSCSIRAVKILKQLFTNVVLRKRIFQYYMLCTMFLCAGCVLVEGFIAPHAVDSGVSDYEVSWLISSIAIADISSKFFIGYVSDKQWIERSTIMGLMAFVLGVCSFFMFFLNSFPSILGYAILVGVLQPVYFSLFPVVAVDILSLKELKGALGFIMLANGLCNAAAFPFAGYLRDVTGRYHATYCFAGTMLIIGGLLNYLLPRVKRFCERAESGINTTEERTQLQQNDNDQSSHL